MNKYRWFVHRGRILLTINLAKTGGIPHSCRGGTSSHYTETAVQSPNGLIKLHSDQIEASGSTQMGRITLTPLNFEKDHINR
jgi:hypothetical protein